jgi:histone acetyltransferase
LIPGISESGWDYKKDYLPMTKNEIKLDFVSQCRSIINKLKEEKSSQPFLYPVNKEQVTDYYEVIKDPMGKYCYFMKKI